MTKIDIFSGFLGAGKTTLIKKLIAEGYTGEKLVLIENEFGEISVDGGFLKDAGVEITEMSSGCICCSLVGDFAEALKKRRTASSSSPRVSASSRTSSAPCRAWATRTSCPAPSPPWWTPRAPRCT